MSDHELLLRCDCGAEHLDLDVWVSKGLDDLEPENVFEESYLTFLAGWQKGRPLSKRLRLAWEILRGREAVFESVILKPEDVTRLRDFARNLPKGVK